MSTQILILQRHRKARIVSASSAAAVSVHAGVVIEVELVGRTDDETGNGLSDARVPLEEPNVGFIGAIVAERAFWIVGRTCRALRAARDNPAAAVMRVPTGNLARVVASRITA